MPSNNACVELLPREFLASITRYPTAILAAIAAPTPSQSFLKWSFRLDFSKRR